MNLKDELVSSSTPLLLNANLKYVSPFSLYLLGANRWLDVVFEVNFVLTSRSCRLELTKRYGIVIISINSPISEYPTGGDRTCLIKTSQSFLEVDYIPTEMSEKTFPSEEIPKSRSRVHKEPANKAWITLESKFAAVFQTSIDILCNRLHIF